MSEDKKLKAIDVLNRYKTEDLPEFSGILLEDVNQVGNFGDQPLHVACTRGLQEEVLALLDGGANVIALGELGNTPLHAAVSQGHIHIVRLLLSHGALVNQKNENNQTPLDIASMYGYSEIFNLLKNQKRSE